MLRLNDIQKALLPVVGWEQGYGDTLLGVAYTEPDITVSESGLTFQAAHPLVTLENVRSIMPADYYIKYPDITSASPSTTYWKGQKVRYKEKYFVCIEDGVGNPDDEPEGWSNWNPLNDFLYDMMKRSVNTVVQQYIQQKQLNRETQNLMERRTLFDGAARLQAVIDPKHRLVGMEIVPVRGLGVTAKIERIGLQMVHGTGEIKMYIFHSSQVSPIYEFWLNYTNTSGGFQWFVPKGDLYLPYLGENLWDDAAKQTDSGGAWYLCYVQDELPEGMRALNVSKDWSSEPCQTCLGGSIESWRQLTKYLQVSPFSTKVPEDWDLNAPKMFDNGQLNYTNTMNYGINLEISVGCDISDFIIMQRSIFATAIQKQVAYDVLRTLAMNPDVRVNRNQVNATRDELLYELDGNPVGRAGGLAYDLKQAYKALDIDTKGLDRICLKCQNGGVRYRTV